jgi:hypothetical protein
MECLIVGQLCKVQLKGRGLLWLDKTTMLGLIDALGSIIICHSNVRNLFSPLFSFLPIGGIYPWVAEDISHRMQAFPRLIEQQLRAPFGSFQFLFDRIEG